MRFTPGIVGVGRSAGTVFREPNTNMVANPEALNSWPVQTTAIATANALNDPEGNLNAETITDGNQGTTGASLIQSAAMTLTTATLYRCSAYVKAGTAPWCNITLVNFGLTLNAFFNPSTGAAGNIGANVTASGSDAAISGWYRCWFTFTTGADVTGNMTIGMASANGTATIARDGTKTLHAWLAQLAIV